MPRTDPPRGFLGALTDVLDSVSRVLDEVDGMELGDFANGLGGMPGFDASVDEAIRERREAARVLGLDGEKWTRDEVRSAYRRAARTAHPDTGGSAEAMARASWARSVLLG